MSEIHFTVEWVPEGGYIAKASNSDIFTEAGVELVLLPDPSQK